MNHVHKAIASAIILGIFAALALCYMTGCALTPTERAVGKTLLKIGEQVAVDEFNTWLNEQ